MISLFAQAPSNTFNPEAIINAAVAASSAALAANQAFYISVAIFAVLLIIGAAMMFLVYKFVEIEHNTDGMRIELVETTRKLALLQGNVKGREELIEEGKQQENK